MASKEGKEVNQDSIYEVIMPEDFTQIFTNTESRCDFKKVI